MAAKVCVKRVAVDYVVQGRAFTIEFTDPMNIGSIVFSPVDLQRAQDKQNELAKLPGSNVPAVIKREFEEFGPFPATGGSGQISERTQTEGMDLSDAGPSLWWHLNACTWFHPADED